MRFSIWTARLFALIFVGILSTSCSNDDKVGPVIDTTKPSVTIAQPASADTLFTNQSVVTVAGTASDDGVLERVVWSYGAESGVAAGTESWTIADLPVQSGAATLVITAYDDAGNSSSAELVIVGDEIPPTGQILGPSGSGAFETVNSSVTLSGVVSDDHLAKITWTTGGEAGGSAEARPEWKFEDVPLEIGENIVVVTFLDRAGNSASDTILVTRYTVAGTLTLNPTAIVTRNTPVRVHFQLDPAITLPASATPMLVRIDSANAIVAVVDTLYDDGNLGRYDDIAGDGVFSNVVEFDEPSATQLRLQVVVQLGSPAIAEARTQVRTITVSEPTSDAANQLQVLVQDSAAKALVTILGQAPDLSTAVEQTASVIEGLDGVAHVEVYGGTAIGIEYESGLRGGIFINEVSPGGGMTRGGLAVSTPNWFEAGGNLPAIMDTVQLRRSKATVPLSRQTVGVYNGKRIAPAALVPAANLYLDGGAGATQQVSTNEILNRKVLIYAPYEFQFAPHNEGEKVAKLLESSPVDFNVTHLSNAQATLAALQSMPDYGMIILATHGAGGEWFATGESATEYNKKLYDALRQDGQVAIWTNVKIEGGAASVTGDVFAVNAKFIQNLNGTFPNSVIINASCESTKTLMLADAFRSRGAQTYLGFSAVVYSGFAVDMVTRFVESLAIDAASTGSAFSAGQTDPVGNFQARWEMVGNAELAYPLDFRNGGFESGDLSYWTPNGDGRVITQLGPLRPTDGQFMGIISTGLGYTVTAGSISQAFKVGSATTLSLKWSFLSEEFLEYVGSPFQDYFRIVVVDTSGAEVTLFEKSIDEIASDFGCTYTDTPYEAPSGSCKLIEVTAAEGITFDVGDVWMTDWQELALDISAFQGQIINLRIEASDIGDSIYDTAILLDAITVH
jgi:hypothetical protein